MALQYSPRIVTDGLMLVLDAADKNSYIGSGTNWYDLISFTNFNNSFYTYPSFSSDNLGCFNFINNGSTVNNIYPTSISINTYNQTQYTRTAAFNTSAFSGAWSPLIQNAIGNNSDMGLTITDGGRLMYRQYSNTQAGGTSGGDFGIVSTNVTLSTNTWYIVTMAVDLVAQYVYFYINGVLDSTVSIGRVIGNASSNTIVIGGAATDSYGGTRMFKGKIAIASHYNRILTASQVQQNYNALKSRFGL
jgi:hypothetical protein